MVSTQHQTDVLFIKTTLDIKLALKAIGEREHRRIASTLETLVMNYFARNRLPFPPVAESAGDAQEPADAKGSQ